MFETDNLSYGERLSEPSELNDFFCQDKISCSTPIKLKDRRSYSLIDVTSLDEELFNRQKLNLSTDTIASGSVCKDSGYVHSESNISLNSTKDHKKLTELIQDLRFKEVLITELQESNHSLRLKYAEAENRIAELRLKCESHCGCCNFKTLPTNEQKCKNHHLKFINSDNVEPCFNKTKLQYSQIGETLKAFVPPFEKSSSIIPSPNDDALNKVKRWQESLNSLNSTSSESSSLLDNRVDDFPVISGSIKNDCIRKNTENNYNELRSPFVQTRIIGDRSVRISLASPNLNNLKKRTGALENSPVKNEEDINVIQNPVKDVTLMIENLQNLIIGEGDLPLFTKNDRLDKRTSIFEREDYGILNDEEIKIDGHENERLTVEGTKASLSFTREHIDKMGRVKYVDRKLEMERTIRDVMNGIAEKGKTESSMRFKPWEASHKRNEHFNCKPSSNSTLYDCLRQASEFADRLSIGLSNIPSNLDRIRSISTQI